MTLVNRNDSLRRTRSRRATMLLGLALLLTANVAEAAGGKAFKQEPPVENSIVGKWHMTLTANGKTIGGAVVFQADGTCRLPTGEGRYTLAKGFLTITYPSGQSLTGLVTWVNPNHFTHTIAGLNCTFVREAAGAKNNPVAPVNSVVGRWNLTITSPGGQKNGKISFTADGSCHLLDARCNYTHANGVLTIDLGNGKLIGPVTWVNANLFMISMNKTTFTFERDS